MVLLSKIKERAHQDDFVDSQPTHFFTFNPTNKPSKRPRRNRPTKKQDEIVIQQVPENKMYVSKR
jgi:hypothetical protein